MPADKEKVRIGKTFSCGSCREELRFDFETEFSLLNFTIDVECPCCTSKYNLTLDSIIKNKGLQPGNAVASTTSTSSSSSSGSVFSSIFDTPPSYSSGSSSSSTSSYESSGGSSSSSEEIPFVEIFEEENR